MSLVIKYVEELSKDGSHDMHQSSEDQCVIRVQDCDYHKTDNRSETITDYFINKDSSASNLGEFVDYEYSLLYSSKLAADTEVYERKTAGRLNANSRFFSRWQKARSKLFGKGVLSDETLEARAIKRVRIGRRGESSAAEAGEKEEEEKLVRKMLASEREEEEGAESLDSDEDEEEEEEYEGEGFEEEGELDIKFTTVWEQDKEILRTQQGEEAVEGHIEFDDESEVRTYVPKSIIESLQKRATLDRKAKQTAAAFMQEHIALQAKEEREHILLQPKGRTTLFKYVNDATKSGRMTQEEAIAQYAEDYIEGGSTTAELLGRGEIRTAVSPRELFGVCTRAALKSLNKAVLSGSAGYSAVTPLLKGSCVAKWGIFHTSAVLREELFLRRSYSKENEEFVAQYLYDQFMYVESDLVRKFIEKEEEEEGKEEEEGGLTEDKLFEFTDVQIQSELPETVKRRQKADAFEPSAVFFDAYPTEPRRRDPDQTNFDAAWPSISSFRGNYTDKDVCPEMEFLRSMNMCSKRMLRNSLDARRRFDPSTVFKGDTFIELTNRTTISRNGEVISNSAKIGKCMADVKLYYGKTIYEMFIWSVVYLKTVASLFVDAYRKNRLPATSSFAQFFSNAMTLGKQFDYHASDAMLIDAVSMLLFSVTRLDKPQPFFETDFHDMLVEVAADLDSFAGYCLIRRLKEMEIVFVEYVRFVAPTNYIVRCKTSLASTVSFMDDILKGQSLATFDVFVGEFAGPSGLAGKYAELTRALIEVNADDNPNDPRSDTLVPLFCHTPYARFRDVYLQLFGKIPKGDEEDESEMKVVLECGISGIEHTVAIPERMLAFFLLMTKKWSAPEFEAYTNVKIDKVPDDVEVGNLCQQMLPPQEYTSNQAVITWLVAMLRVRLMCENYASRFSVRTGDLNSYCHKAEYDPYLSRSSAGHVIGFNAEDRLLELRTANQVRDYIIAHRGKCLPPIGTKIGVLLAAVDRHWHRIPVVREDFRKKTSLSASERPFLCLELFRGESEVMMSRMRPTELLISSRLVQKTLIPKLVNIATDKDRTAAEEAFSVMYRGIGKSLSDIVRHVQEADRKESIADTEALDRLWADTEISLLDICNGAQQRFSQDTLELAWKDQSFSFVNSFPVQTLAFVDRRVADSFSRDAAAKVLEASMANVHRKTNRTTGEVLSRTVGNADDEVIVNSDASAVNKLQRYLTYFCHDKESKDRTMRALGVAVLSAVAKGWMVDHQLVAECPFVGHLLQVADYEKLNADFLPLDEQVEVNKLLTCDSATKTTVTKDLFVDMFFATATNNKTSQKYITKRVDVGVEEIHVAEDMASFSGNLPMLRANSLLIGFRDVNVKGTEREYPSYLHTSREDDSVRECFEHMKKTNTLPRGFSDDAAKYWKFCTHLRGVEALPMEFALRSMLLIPSKANKATVTSIFAPLFGEHFDVILNFTMDPRSGVTSFEDLYDRTKNNTITYTQAIEHVVSSFTKMGVVGCSVLSVYQWQIFIRAILPEFTNRHISPQHAEIWKKLRESGLGIPDIEGSGGGGATTTTAADELPTAAHLVKMMIYLGLFKRDRLDALPDTAKRVIANMPLKFLLSAKDEWKLKKGLDSVGDLPDNLDTLDLLIEDYPSDLAKLLESDPAKASLASWKSYLESSGGEKSKSVPLKDWSIMKINHFVYAQCFIMLAAIAKADSEIAFATSSGEFTFDQLVRDKVCGTAWTTEWILGVVDKTVDAFGDWNGETLFSSQPVTVSRRALTTLVDNDDRHSMFNITVPSSHLPEFLCTRREYDDDDEDSANVVVQYTESDIQTPAKNIFVQIAKGDPDHWFVKMESSQTYSVAKLLIEEKKRADGGKKKFMLSRELNEYNFNYLQDAKNNLAYALGNRLVTGVVDLAQIYRNNLVYKGHTSYKKLLESRRGQITESTALLNRVLFTERERRTVREPYSDRQFILDDTRVPNGYAFNSYANADPAPVHPIKFLLYCVLSRYNTSAGLPGSHHRDNSLAGFLRKIEDYSIKPNHDILNVVDGIIRRNGQRSSHLLSLYAVEFYSRLFHLKTGDDYRNTVFAMLRLHLARYIYFEMFASSDNFEIEHLRKEQIWPNVKVARGKEQVKKEQEQEMTGVKHTTMVHPNITGRTKQERRKMRIEARSKGGVTSAAREKSKIGVALESRDEEREEREEEEEVDVNDPDFEPEEENDEDDELNNEVFSNLNNLIQSARSKGGDPMEVEEEIIEEEEEAEEKEKEKEAGKSRKKQKLTKGAESGDVIGQVLSNPWFDEKSGRSARNRNSWMDCAMNGYLSEGDIMPKWKLFMKGVLSAMSPNVVVSDADPVSKYTESRFSADMAHAANEYDKVYDLESSEGKVVMAELSLTAVDDFFAPFLNSTVLNDTIKALADNIETVFLDTSKRAEVKEGATKFSGQMKWLGSQPTRDLVKQIYGGRFESLTGGSRKFGANFDKLWKGIGGATDISNVVDVLEDMTEQLFASSRNCVLSASAEGIYMTKIGHGDEADEEFAKIDVHNASRDYYLDMGDQLLKPSPSPFSYSELVSSLGDSDEAERQEGEERTASKVSENTKQALREAFVLLYMAAISNPGLANDTLFFKIMFLLFFDEAAARKFKQESDEFRRTACLELMQTTTFFTTLKSVVYDGLLNPVWSAPRSNPAAAAAATTTKSATKLDFAPSFCLPKSSSQVKFADLVTYCTDTAYMAFNDAWKVYTSNKKYFRFSGSSLVYSERSHVNPDYLARTIDVFGMPEPESEKSQGRQEFAELISFFGKNDYIVDTKARQNVSGQKFLKLEAGRFAFKWYQAIATRKFDSKIQLGCWLYTEESLHNYAEMATFGMSDTLGSPRGVPFAIDTRATWLLLLVTNKNRTLNKDNIQGYDNIGMQRLEFVAGKRSDAYRYVKFFKTDLMRVCGQEFDVEESATQTPFGECQFSIREARETHLPDNFEVLCYDPISTASASVFLPWDDSASVAALSTNELYTTTSKDKKPYSVRSVSLLTNSAKNKFLASSFYPGSKRAQESDKDKQELDNRTVEVVLLFWKNVFIQRGFNPVDAAYLHERNYPTYVNPIINAPDFAKAGFVIVQQHGAAVATAVESKDGWMYELPDEDSTNFPKVTDYICEQVKKRTGLVLRGFMILIRIVNTITTEKLEMRQRVQEIQVRSDLSGHDNFMLTDENVWLAVTCQNRLWLFARSAALLPANKNFPSVINRPVLSFLVPTAARASASSIGDIPVDMPLALVPEPLKPQQPTLTELERSRVAAFLKAATSQHGGVLADVSQFKSKSGGDAQTAWDRYPSGENKYRSLVHPFSEKESPSLSRYVGCTVVTTKDNPYAIFIGSGEVVELVRIVVFFPTDLKFALKTDEITHYTLTKHKNSEKWLQETLLTSDGTKTLKQLVEAEALETSPGFAENVALFMAILSDALTRATTWDSGVDDKYTDVWKVRIDVNPQITDSTDKFIKAFRDFALSEQTKIQY